MLTKVRHFIAQLTYVPKTLGLIWAAAPGFTLVWVVLLIAQGLLPAATVYLTGLLVDSLAAAVGGGVAWENIQPSLVLALFMAGTMLATQILQGTSEWVRMAQAELVQDYLSDLIHERSAAVDLSFYESPEYHDRLYQARSDLLSLPLSLLTNGGNLLQSIITLLAMGAILLPYGLWLPITLFISTLPAFYVLLRYNQRYHQWWKQTTSDRRLGDYYSTMLTAALVAAEVRLFDLGFYFRSAHRQLRQRLRSERLQLMKGQSLARLGAGVMTVIISGVAVAWMAWQTFLGLVTLGDLALFYQVFNRGQGLLSSLLGGLGQIYNNILFLGNLFEFLELKPEVRDPVDPVLPPSTLKEGIRFRQVTFRYPGSDRAVFQNFDFMIPAGKIVAIVGENGVGKTTLVKLLCRFYDPESGSIELDGIDLRHLPVKALRRMITSMFQFPVPYYVRAAENIALGDLTAKPGPIEIEAAARNAGAHEFIMHLPQGYNTPLGKLFAGGAELSGGQWQRLALARAFLRKAQIMILDEPTSFMDSWAEVDWFDRLRVLTQGRTAIVITHRFNIAKRADIIYVMEKGQVVEVGSHDELLAQGGRYAQSWAAQMNTTTSQSELDPVQPDPILSATLAGYSTESVSVQNYPNGHLK